jgi:gamma-glutamyltranspeptidase/glutathione hydrolase
MTDVDPSADPKFDRTGRRTDPAAFAATGAGGMVCCAHYKASEVGAAVLADGGNAIDAAVAVGLALTVAEPAGSGIGGMAQLIVHRADGEPRTVAVAGPCLTPRAATPKSVPPTAEERKGGPAAIAVPTHLATLGTAHERFGRLSWARLVEPAAALARSGVALTPGQSELIRSYRGKLARRPDSAARFLAPDGTAPTPGTIVRCEALAGTLDRLATAGWRDAYTGEIGAALADGIEAAGGFVRRDDLDPIPLPTIAEPLTVGFGPWRLCLPDAPAGGRTLAQMAVLLEALEADTGEPNRLADPWQIAEAAAVIERARRDRVRFRKRPTDPERLSEANTAVGLKRIRERLRPLRNAMLGERAGAPEPFAAPDAPGETSHIAVVDRDGNAVALTQSIERAFGSGVFLPDLGVLLNGYLAAFKVQSRTHPNFLAPGAPARSNATPTIALDRETGDVRVVVGCTGSERLASAIFCCMIRLRAGVNVHAAVSAPRLHATPDGIVQLEAGRIDEATKAALTTCGYTLADIGPWSFAAGGMQAITREPGGRACGVADPRRDGSAEGPGAVPGIPDGSR